MTHRQAHDFAASAWQALIAPETLIYGRPFSADDVKFNIGDHVVFWDTDETDAMPVFGHVVAVHATSYDVDVPDNHIPANYDTVNIPARDLYAA